MTKPMSLTSLVALAMTAAEEVEDDVAQANAFLAVAKLIAAQGEANDAAPVLERALTLCRKLEPAERVWSISRAVLPMSRTDPDRIPTLAAEAFAAAKDTDLAKYVLTPICRALARIGLLDVALEGLAAFPEPDRQDALGMMVADLLKIGDEPSARRVIALLADRQEAAMHERDCILALAAAGRMDEAFIRAAALDDPLQRCLAYVDLYRR